MAVQIQLRRGLSSQWNSSNPILAQGEPGLELDTGRIKIGNSASTWTQLSYSTTLGEDYLSLIAASANFLTKSDASNIYAPLGSASFVGTPTAPTANAGTNTHQIATTAFVRTEVTNLIDSAPGALDTLNELAAALGDDPNYAVSTASYIATKLDINNASATYLSISNAALTYVPISASSNIVDNYIPISSSYAYLTRDDASSLYIPITASGPYLTELEASALYVPISASANVVENYIPISSSYAYLTRSDAENTYIPISSSAEYLTESEAQGIYVPISSSANIVENYIPVSSSFAYLTRTDAESTYIPITASAEYLTESEAQGIYVPISSSANIVENYIPVSSSYAYLTRTDAENTYIPISSSAEYLTESEAAGIYVPISASFNIRTGLLEQSEAANVYAPLSSASLTGVPVAPTATAGTNTKQIATTEFVRTEITNLVDSAPNTLDTLNELAAALGDDPNFATSTASAIGERLTIANASATYLSMSDAQLTYIPISASGEYLTGFEAAGLYVPISSSYVFSDAQTLDGQDGSFYLDWFNITSKPNVIVGIELTGNTNGSGSVTLTELNNGQVSITTNTNFATHSNSASSINWSGITDTPDPIIGVSLSGNTIGAASVTLSNLNNGQIELLTKTEFAETASSIAISGVVGLQHELNSSASAIGERLTIENASATYRPISAAVDADTLDGYDATFFINSSSAVQEKDGNFTFHGRLTVNDLVISGSALTLSTTNLSLTDSLVQLAHEQYSTDSVDIGIIGSYGDGTTSSAGHYHTSFARDASQNKWKLLENGPAPVNNVIDYSDPSVEYGILQLGAIEVSSSVTVVNLNSDMLDDQHGSYYLDWNNTTSKPSPIIGVELTGSITGAASATLTNLGNGQIRITTSGGGGSASVDWLTQVNSKPDPIIGVNLTGIITGAASATLIDLQNGQVSITTAMNIITNAQSGTSYSLVLSDAGDLVELSNASPITLVIPLNSTQPFPVGTKIDILQTGAGQVTASYVSGVTLNSSGGKNKLTGQWSAASLIKRGTDTWALIGDLA